jgi:hypothetical protein
VSGCGAGVVGVPVLPDDLVDVRVDDDDAVVEVLGDQDVTVRQGRASEGLDGAGLAPNVFAAEDPQRAVRGC